MNADRFRAMKRFWLQHYWVTNNIMALLVGLLCIWMLTSCATEPNLIPVDKNQINTLEHVTIYALGPDAVQNMCQRVSNVNACGCGFQIGEGWVFVYNRESKVCQEHEQDHMKYGPLHVGE